MGIIKHFMAKILCFGDSNTWGTRPEGGRYDETQRWSSLLGGYLNAAEVSVSIIEAGQPNRTLVHNAPFDGNKSGVSYLKPLLKQHQPDVLILLLGTNDLKAKFDLSAREIALAAAQLIEQVQAFTHDPVIEKTSITLLLVSPPVIREVGAYKQIYKAGSAKSKSLAFEYAKQAERLECHFFDANEVVTSSELDGIHWEGDEHKKLAKGLSSILSEMLNSEN